MDSTSIQPAPVHMRCGDALVVVSTARRRHRAAEMSPTRARGSAAPARGSCRHLQLHKGLNCCSLWVLAVSRRACGEGARGCPAHRLGVRGRFAERAAPQCPAGSGTDAPALTSIPDAVLH